MYFYAESKGKPCGHQHRDLGLELAKCWRGRNGSHVMRVGDDGAHKRVPASQLAPLRALVPREGRGRPPGKGPRQAYATPLYARLTVDQRARFEALAKGVGLDLGAYAVALLEQAVYAADMQVTALTAPPLDAAVQGHIDALKEHIAALGKPTPRNR